MTADSFQITMIVRIEPTDSKIFANAVIASETTPIGDHTIVGRRIIIFMEEMMSETAMCGQVAVIGLAFQQKNIRFSVAENVLGFIQKINLVLLFVQKSYRQAGGDNRRSMRVEQQDLEEPEWFTEGPSSQLDTIELVGFETGERPKQQLRKGPALKDNLIRNTHRPEPEGSCSTLPKSGEGFDFNQFVEKSDAPPIEVSRSRYINNVTIHSRAFKFGIQQTMWLVVRKLEREQNSVLG